jgi:dTDP-4-amino-4,6-dideoxygalactose transaminase
MTLPYGRQDVNDDDVAAVAAALRDPFLTQGPAVEGFEVELAARTPTRARTVCR